MAVTTANPYEENRREFALPSSGWLGVTGRTFQPAARDHSQRKGKGKFEGQVRFALRWMRPGICVKRVEETIELGLSFNTRLVTVEKSRDDEKVIKWCSH